jgi:rubrerythrin
LPFSCPKCRRVLEEIEICCAQVHFMWRCTRCYKLTTGDVVPHGTCFLCGGKLEVIPDRALDDPMHFPAIHDAAQFELDAFFFYKRARERASTPEQCIVLEHLCEAELEYLHELEEKYHAHLDREMVELAADEEKLLSDWPFRGIRVNEESGIKDLYRVALKAELRAREHFLELARQFPVGLENELCREVAAEEEEHVARLETELEQLA